MSVGVCFGLCRPQLSGRLANPTASESSNSYALALDPWAEIVDHLGTHQPHVSKHLRVLADSGIVAAQRHGRLRIYHLEAEPFTELQTWVETFERTWDERLDRLGDLLHDAGHDGPDPESGPC